MVLAAVAVVAIALLPAGAFAAYAATWLVLVARVRIGAPGCRSGWCAAPGSCCPSSLVALPLLFTRAGETVFTFVIGPLDLTITDTGLRDVLSIMLKSWLSVQAALLLTYTTPFSAWWTRFVRST